MLRALPAEASVLSVLSFANATEVAIAMKEKAKVNFMVELLASINSARQVRLQSDYRQYFVIRE